MTLSRELVRLWMGLSRDSIPPAVQQAAGLHCLDAVGVGLAASALEQGMPYRRFANAAAAGPISTLSGIPVHDAADAALINGGLMHSLEFDDTHTASIVHGSAVLAPVALGVGQTYAVDPKHALHAYLIGYEMLIRIGLAAQGGFQRKGFQITSVAGALITALIACDIAKASEDERVHAVGIALSQASGVFEFLSNGSSVKSMHPGWAAHAGVLAARLAMAGLTGPETAIEGSRGLFAAFAGDADAPDRLRQHLSNFGTRWHMPDVAFKLMPCCHYLHPFVEAAGEIAASIPDLSQIEAITLRIAQGAAPIVCDPWSLKLDPADGHAARWSLPVVTAARLVEGRVDLDTFRQKASPAVLAVAAKCEWVPLETHHFPNAFEAEIECRLKDGTTVSARVNDVLGNASRPVDEATVLTKFRANAGRSLTSAAVSDLEAFFLQREGSDFAPFASCLTQRV